MSDFTWYAVGAESKRHVVYKQQPDPMHGENWMLKQADADGWIEWHGGECPLPDDSKCEVKNAIGDIFAFCRAENVWGMNWVWGVTHYRSILNSKEEEMSKEWDGKSWPPPIGSVIESSATWEDGTPAEVLAVRKGKVIGCHVDTGVAGWLDREYCRPLRSEEDKAVEAMAKVVEEGLGHASGLIECTVASSAIYRAIRDGRIPGVRLEDKS